MQARKSAFFSKSENPVNVIKAKQAFYSMGLLSMSSYALLYVQRAASGTESLFPRKGS
ncbi:TPA: hypothetical protein HA338_01980 [Methanosarcina acetivorans]|uniref:Uncharacterized protein n=1 Tax=Methanosarcina acetivorans TaxID=2214 RepID=A0A832SGA2_9EURY|nr:hypothetical protein [Methanosarcina acetivorans]HIH92845.1 hypothetical protein [Methanosarcina acetivorans]